MNEQPLHLQLQEHFFGGLLHCPEQHLAGEVHDPQLPPQPSDPQLLPEQLGTQLSGCWVSGVPESGMVTPLPPSRVIPEEHWHAPHDSPLELQDWTPWPALAQRQTWVAPGTQGPESPHPASSSRVTREIEVFIVHLHVMRRAQVPANTGSISSF